MSVEFVREHAPEDFSEIISELERRPLPVNHDRLVAGKGRSQAFGVIRRWSYRPWISRNTWLRPELWSLLLKFAENYVQVDWDAVQVNENYRSAPHRDKGNCGMSYIVSFGAHSAGELNVEGTLYDIRHRGHLFNGAELLHSTAAWVGQRYSLVFFQIEWPSRWPRYSIQCRLIEDGLEVSDEYDESVTVLDRRGHIVRIVKPGKPVGWVGKLTKIGQKSKQSLTAPPTPDHDHNESV